MLARKWSVAFPLFFVLLWSFLATLPFRGRSSPVCARLPSVLFGGRPDACGGGGRRPWRPERRLPLSGGGHEVTVLERENEPGGLARGLDIGNHHFQRRTALTMPDILASTFNAAGYEMTDFLQVRPVDPMYRARFPDGSCCMFAGTPRPWPRRCARDVVPMRQPP